jgi:dolichol kinase
MLLGFLIGLGKVILFFIGCIVIVALITHFVNLPKEVFRKSLHLILLFSLLFFLYAFENWWLAALAALAFMAIVFLALSLAEKKIKRFSEHIHERKNGEIKTSMVLALMMFALMIAIGWGWLGERWLTMVCVYAWGFGDAAAALIGKKYGKRKINAPFADNQKTVDGTVTMFLVSFVTVLLILLLNVNLAWYG